jgi:aryl-alcohol dehydrogenase-like predicted oxidoreductase
MAALVQEGKARAIGVSNVTLVELEEAAQSAQVASVQNEYSLLAREAEHDVLPCCRELGIGFVPYYPLAAGLLTVKYRRGKPPPRGTRWAGSDVFAGDGWVTRQVSTAQATFDMVARLETFARARGRTLLELAIAGVASRPGVASVIAGATSPGQVRAGQWQLLPHELAELRSLVG